LLAPRDYQAMTICGAWIEGDGARQQALDRPRIFRAEDERRVTCRF